MHKAAAGPRLGYPFSLGRAWPFASASVVLPLIPLLPLALGDEILVPLTQSLYVPGTISDADKVGHWRGREGGGKGGARVAKATVYLYSYSMTVPGMRGHGVAHGELLEREREAVWLLSILSFTCLISPLCTSLASFFLFPSARACPFSSPLHTHALEPTLTPTGPCGRGHRLLHRKDTT